MSSDFLNFYSDSAPIFIYLLLFYSIFFYSILQLQHNHTNLLTVTCSPVWLPRSIILSVCGNHTWAKKEKALQVVSHVSITPEEIPIQTSEPLRETSEMKSEGNDLTGVRALVTGQKPVIFLLARWL